MERGVHRFEPVRREERSQQREGLGVCFNVEKECVRQIAVQGVPCLILTIHLEQGADDGDGITDVVEGLGLLVGISGSYGKVVDDPLPEVVALRIGQPAVSDGPNDGMEIPPASLPIVLQESALLEIANGPGQSGNCITAFCPGRVLVPQPGVAAKGPFRRASAVPVLPPTSSPMARRPRLDLALARGRWGLSAARMV